MLRRKKEKEQNCVPSKNALSWKKKIRNSYVWIVLLCNHHIYCLKEERTFVLPNIIMLTLIRNKEILPFIIVVGISFSFYEIVWSFLVIRRNFFYRVRAVVKRDTKRGEGKKEPSCLIDTRLFSFFHCIPQQFLTVVSHVQSKAKCFWNKVCDTSFLAKVNISWAQSGITATSFFEVHMNELTDKSGFVLIAIRGPFSSKKDFVENSMPRRQSCFP